MERLRNSRVYGQNVQIHLEQQNQTFTNPDANAEDGKNMQDIRTNLEIKSIR